MEYKYDVNKLETGFAAEIRWLMDRRLKEEIGIAGIWRRKRQNKRTKWKEDNKERKIYGAGNRRKKLTAYYNFFNKRKFFRIRIKLAEKEMRLVKLFLLICIAFINIYHVSRSFPDARKT